MVLGLQGYYTLQKYGSSEAIGVLVALVIGKRIRPCCHCTFICRKSWNRNTAEIGLMKATEQLSAMEMMAVSPIARIIAPRFWAGVITDAYSSFNFFNGWCLGWLCCSCSYNWG